jgi:heme/copper-type cytochrome/quinol oxidase subunit 4
MSESDDGMAMRSLNSSSSNSDSLSYTASPHTAAALSALHNPQFSAAINALAALQQPGVAAALVALQQYNNQRMEARPDFGIEVPSSAMTSRQSSFKRMKPVVRNNLFIITVVWTLIGLFLLYASQAKNETSVAIFVIYGIVQCTLAIFILLVTYERVIKIQHHTVTLGFLLQGWLALTLIFAGLYLFFYHSFTIGLNQSTANVTHQPPCSTNVCTALVLTLLQTANTGLRATGFVSACVYTANFTDAFVDEPAIT